MIFNVKHLLRLIDYDLSRYKELGCILVIDNCSIYSLKNYDDSQLFYCTKVIAWAYSDKMQDVEIIKLRKFGNGASMSETLRRDIIGKYLKFYREVKL